MYSAAPVGGLANVDARSVVVVVESTASLLSYQVTLKDEQQQVLVPSCEQPADFVPGRVLAAFVPAMPRERRRNTPEIARTVFRIIIHSF
jgi:hypothetical protein